MKTFLAKKIDKYLDEGLVQREKHPEENIYILNYTNKCQYDWIWDEVTLRCRGLIVDEDYRVIQRPFKKFFTWEQYLQLDTPKLFGLDINNIRGKSLNNILDYHGRCSTKYDGSLGILYWINKNGKDYPNIATRGRFNSDQAIHASEILHSKYSHTFDLLRKDITYLFEIIYPENRIVIDYEQLDDIILIATINTQTGKDDLREYKRLRKSFSTFYPVETTLRNILSGWNKKTSNIEGFVLHYPNLDDFRIKFKTEEYLELNKAICALTPKFIYKLWEENRVSEILPKLPDEFHQEVLDKINGYNKIYRQIEVASKWHMKYSNLNKSSRKAFASSLSKISKRLHPIMWNLFDNKPIKDSIQKIIKRDHL